MEKEIRMKLEKAIINLMTDISFKHIIEDDDELGEAYNNDEFDPDDFYAILEEKSKLLGIV